MRSEIWIVINSTSSGQVLNAVFNKMPNYRYIDILVNFKKKKEHSKSMQNYQSAQCYFLQAFHQID